MVSQIPQYGFKNSIYNTSFGANSAQNPFASMTSNMPAVPVNNTQADTFPKTDDNNKTTNSIQTNPFQNLSKNQKIGLGAGAATLATIAFFIARGKVSQAK